MPVDFCTPLIFALSMVTLPIYAGMRGTRAAFAAVCALCLAANVGAGLAVGAPVLDVLLLVLVPLWAIPNTVGWAILLTRLRRRAGPVFRCRICGYDLRDTPERCPECGSIPNAAAATAIATANAAADALDAATSPRSSPADRS